jgi:hypothetical protein
MKRLFAIALLLAGAAARAQSDVPQVTAHIRPDSVMIGDRFDLVVDVEKDLVQVVQGGGIIGAARGAGLLLAVVVIIGAAQVVQGVGGGADLLAAHVERVQGEKKKPRAAAQVVRVSLWACVVGAGLLLIRQGRGGAVLPFAGGVRFSTLPGSALGVGLELSGL